MRCFLIICYQLVVFTSLIHFLTAQEPSKLDAESQYQSGMKYFFGDGVAKDEQKGVQFFKKAAGNGNANAQTRLAIAYSKGVGVKQSYS